MEDKELFNLVSSELFKTGSCTPNEWISITITKDGHEHQMETMHPSKGNINIRRVKRVNGQGEVLEHSVFKFNNKQELVFDGEYYTDTWLEERDKFLSRK